MTSTVKLHSQDSFFIFPFSVSAVLSVLLNGADGSTAEKLQRVLGVGDIEAVNSYYKLLTDNLMKTDPTSSLSVSNALWYNTTSSFGGLQNEFAEIGVVNYDMYFKEADFTDSGIIEEVNKWCEAATNGTIEKIVEFVAPTSTLRLINATYFESKWIIAYGNLLEIYKFVLVIESL